MGNRSSWRHVRSADQKWLHQIALRLRREGMAGDLTEGQERLWVQVIAELEWRSSRKRRWVERCCCDLCRSPFPELDGESDGPGNGNVHYRRVSEPTEGSDGLLEAGSP